MLDHRIDTFLALCDCMNYRKAAEVLQLTQPAVTQQIQHLERLYGCKLFSYENHKLVKTSHADILEKYARAAKLQEYTLREKLVDQVIAATGIPSGQFLRQLTMLELKGLIVRLPGNRLALRK